MVAARGSAKRSASAGAARKKLPVFAVSEHGSSGGESYCWVERRRGRYFMFGNELGRMSGPCLTVHHAVTEPGFQFGMDYIELEASIGEDELRAILSSHAFILENCSRITVNGVDAEGCSVEAAIRAYARSRQA